jgi:hypothetical protein
MIRDANRNIIPIFLGSCLVIDLKLSLKLDILSIVMTISIRMAQGMQIFITGM